jgi:hypothetical protein
MVSIGATRREDEGEASEGRGCGGGAQRVRRERRHEREAGWDKIKKGKDSPVMVQDKDRVSTSMPAGNGPEIGWRWACHAFRLIAILENARAESPSMSAGVRRCSCEGRGTCACGDEGVGVTTVPMPVLVDPERIELGVNGQGGGMHRVGAPESGGRVRRGKFAGTLRAL